MMKSLKVFLILLFIITGCSITPPPKIESGIYYNPSHEFAVTIPPGWQANQNIPDWLKKIENREHVRIVFFNKATNGMILIECQKNLVDVYALDHDDIRKNMESYLRKKKEEHSKDRYIKAYSYKIFTVNHWTESLIYENELSVNNVYSDCIGYRCHKDDTCFVNIILVSNTNTYKNNLKVYNKALKSFRHGSNF